jgi:hypothetical protein
MKVRAIAGRPPRDGVFTNIRSKQSRPCRGRPMHAPRLNAQLFGGAVHSPYAVIRRKMVNKPCWSRFWIFPLFGAVEPSELRAFRQALRMLFP